MHIIAQLKPVDVKSNTYIDFNKKINSKNPKFKIGDIIRISKYKNIFAKGYTQNWSEEVFVIKKVKNSVPWTYIISDLKGAVLLKRFMKKSCKKKKKKKKKNNL